MFIIALILLSRNLKSSMDRLYDVAYDDFTGLLDHLKSSMDRL